MGQVINLSVLPISHLYNGCNDTSPGCLAYLDDKIFRAEMVSCNVYGQHLAQWAHLAQLAESLNTTVVQIIMMASFGGVLG